jgi:hypothetical protein
MTDQPDKSEEAVEDLDVAESESEDVKGGSLNYSKIEFEHSAPKKQTEVARWNFENAWPSK